MSTRSVSAVPTQSMGFSQTLGPNFSSKRVQTQDPASCLALQAQGANTGRPGFPVSSGLRVSAGRGVPTVARTLAQSSAERGEHTASLGKTQQSSCSRGFWEIVLQKKG